MENNNLGNNQTLKPEEIIPVKKFSITLFIAMIAFILVGAFTTYYFSEKSTLKNRFEELTLNISEYSGKIEKLKGQEVEKALLAKQSLEELKKSKIYWSKVVTRLLEKTPRASDKENAKSLVNYSSYSGNQDAKITVSGSTLDHEYISELIRILGKSGFFKEALVPSISKGVNEKGEDIYVFSLNMGYFDETGATTEVEGMESSGGIPRN